MSTCFSGSPQVGWDASNGVELKKGNLGSRENVSFVTEWVPSKNLSECRVKNSSTSTLSGAKNFRWTSQNSAPSLGLQMVWPNLLVLSESGKNR